MKNRVCEILAIEKPVIQAPLNWLTNGRYIAAVSRAGGLGVLGVNAGQTESVFTVEETVENMRREIRARFYPSIERSHDTDKDDHIIYFGEIVAAYLLG